MVNTVGKRERRMKLFGKIKKDVSRQSRAGTIGRDLNFAAAEAYKRLRTNLLFSFSGDESCHVIGVTSSLRGEGKSTTSMNLAFSLAEANRKVLLVDADMRLPQAHAILGIRQSPGLSNVLVGENNGSNLIQPSGIHPDLHIITAGDISPNPTELLGSRRLVGMLESLRPRYDFIVIDLPPVDAVADALIVSKLEAKKAARKAAYGDRGPGELCGKERAGQYRAPAPVSQGEYPRVCGKLRGGKRRPLS